jgi:putative photosynthetic complex assembly protein 2
VLRLSAKLNLFLGVRTLNDELLPRHLRHLRTYFRQREMNPLFPVSIVGSAAVTALLIAHAAAPEASEFGTAGSLLLASLLALGLIEHIFMMVPMPIARLWGLTATPEPAMAPEANLKPGSIKPT